MANVEARAGIPPEIHEVAELLHDIGCWWCLRSAQDQGFCRWSQKEPARWYDEVARLTTQHGLTNLRDVLESIKTVQDKSKRREL